MNYGIMIRAKRIELGMSQGRLADLTGMGQSTISAIERGEAEPTVTQAYKIFKVLDIKIELEMEKK